MAVVEQKHEQENPLVEGLERLPVHPTTLVIFGGTGDLAQRKLLPAIYNLAHEGALPERFNLIAVSRSEMSDDEYREGGARVDRAVLAPRARRAGARQAARAGALRARHVRRRHASSSRLERGARQVRRGGGDRRSTASSTSRRRRRFFALIVEKLGEHGLDKHEDAEVRVVIEKPFGTRLAEAKELNREVLSVLRRVAGLPHRPLPGQGDGPERHGVPVRERDVRADLEPQLHRLRPDHRGGGPRHRRAARATTTRRARCATWSRTTCSSC